jgi:pimeloyl-ACP methyl ester carboxylesterase
MRPAGIATIVLVVLSLSSPACYAQLSQNSGINSADTWVTFALTTQTQANSSSLTRPMVTQTFQVELGYDSNGGIVVNLWPTGWSAVGSDSGEVSVIRLAGGNVTAFDQTGALIPYVAPTSSAPAFNPLGLLGTNPGASVLSQLVVSNIQTQATDTNSQLSYSGSNALLMAPVNSGQTIGNAQWTYAPSGSLWVATQVVFSMTKSNISVTRTLQFSNVRWNNNTTNNTTRANKGSTATNPPPITTSTPSVLSGSSSSGCPPYLSNLGGTQNIAFLHGFFSSGCTWSRMAPWLNQKFRWGAELVPSLNWADNLTNQGNALVNDINSSGGTNYILLGHSQGGLISRSAAQYFQNLNPPPPVPPVVGVLTVDTPHQGAPIAALAQGELQSVLFGDLSAVWQDVGCSSPYDNLLCYLVDIEYSGISQQLINIGSLTDLVPGSTFLTHLNSQPENFKKGALVGNTSRRWIEVRIADALLLKGCNPEDFCGERNVASIYGIIYDSVQISWDISEFVCLFEGDPIACSVADYLLPIWIDMDIADLDYNIVTAGGNPQDGIVPSASQDYPSSAAIQYPVNGADSHIGATRSDRTRNVLEQALSQQFLVPTQASCGFSTSPASYSTSGVAGSGTFTLNTGAGCQWSAVSQAPWLSITSGTTGTSGGTVGFSVAANPQTIPRTGTIVVGDGSSSTPFTVQQAGLCTYTLSTNAISIPSGGGSATISVATGTGCVWSAASNATWLTLTNGGGTGPGSFTVSASANTGGTDLIANVTVMSQTLTVILGNPVGTPGMGSFTITGGPNLTTICKPGCTPTCGDLCMETIWEYGSVWVNIGGDTYTVSYGGNPIKPVPYSTSTLATNLATAINKGSLVSATVSGSTITVVSNVKGALTNYSLGTHYSYDTRDFSSPAFTAALSGPTLTGGTD